MLSSGSSGNVAYVENDHDAVLLDAGISYKKLSLLSEEMAVSLRKVRGILVTHEHGDHSKSAGVIARKLGVPILTTGGTWDRIRARAGKLPNDGIRIHRAGESFVLASFMVETFALSHDAHEPCGYMVGSDGRKVAFVTDTGLVSEELRGRLRECAGLVLEANHDEQMLKTGPYPYHLKKRILGEKGHLSNRYCRDLLLQVMGEKTRAVTLAHLSEENNRPSLAEACVEEALLHRRDVKLSVAPRFQPTAWIEL